MRSFKNIINEEVFNPYLESKIKEISPLFESGILDSNSFFDSLAENSGSIIKMPYFADLYGSDEVITPNKPLAPVKMPTANQDVAVLLSRGKAWSQNDLMADLASADPVKAIGNTAAKFWAEKLQRTFQSMLKGIFAVSSMSTKTLDITGQLDEKAKFSCESFIDAMEKMGDAKDNITAVVMHSAVEAALQKNKLITTVPENGKIKKYFMGKYVITDDKCPISAEKFTTYLLGKGAFAYGNAAVPHQCETVRDSLSGNDILINRKNYLMHPRGIKWTGSASAISPSNTDLEMSKNWEKAYDDKAIRIVKFVHKI